MSKYLFNPGPTNTSLSTKIAQWKGSDVCHRTSEFQTILQSAKDLLSAVFLQNAEEMQDNFVKSILAGSGTTAMEAMISSLAPHSNVLVINNGHYAERAMAIMDVYGIHYQSIKAYDMVDLCRAVQEMKETSNYDPGIEKVVYFVETETSTGEYFSPLLIETLFYNAKFLIDATASFGSINHYNPKRIIGLSFCSNKALRSTPGLGIVLWNRDVELHRRNFSLYLGEYKDKMPFTLPTQSVYALEKTLRSRLGMDLDDTETLKDYQERRIALIRAMEDNGYYPINTCSSPVIAAFHLSVPYTSIIPYLENSNVVVYKPSLLDEINSIRISTLSHRFYSGLPKLVRELNEAVARARAHTRARRRKQKMHKVVYIDMVADLFHRGHIEILRKAGEMGSYLIVGIHADSDVAKYKRMPIIPMKDRAEIVRCIEFVDEVVEYAPLIITKDFIDKYTIDVVVHGNDSADEFEHFYNVPKRLGIYREVPYTKGVSTSSIIRTIREREDL